MNIKIALKYVIGVVSTIFLGAIGSGIWEKLLSPSLGWLYRASVDLISSVSLDYKNDIYAAAASGFGESYSFRLFLLSLLVFVLIGLYMTACNNFFIRILKDIFINSKLAKPRMLLQIIGLSIAIYTLNNATNHIVIKKTNNYSLTSLEILRPYIGDKRFYEFRSNYFQIKTAESFYEFNEAIITEAKIHNVSLPDFEPI